MLLQQLRAYADHIDSTPTLYSEGSLRYIVELDARGGLLSNQLTDLSDPTSAVTKRGRRRPLPQVVRASAVKPLLLADKGDYALGYVSETAKPERVAQAHKAFMDLLDRCARETETPEVAAVLEFLASDALSDLQFDEGFDPGAIITFRVGDILPIDLPSVQRFWAKANDPGRTDGQQTARVMQCLICGEKRPVVERLQLKVKGVPGGQTAGTSLISANSPAFESYGLPASLIAPTCADCGERFTKALNELLANPLNSVRVAGIAFVFWTRAAAAVSLRSTLVDADPEQVQALLVGVASGRPQRVIEPERFYAASLSGSGGRAVVRDWIDTTVESARAAVGRWFRDQEVVDRYGGDHRPLGLMALAFALVREPRDLPPALARALFRAAITGEPVAITSLHRLNERNRAERDVTRQRAALTRLILIRNDIIKEGELIALNPNSPDIAYQCGRLLAVLEEAQRAAQPRVTNTIVDRFYGTASSAPATVFGRLLRGVQPHLSVLESDPGKRGAYYAIQTKLAEVTANIPTFPAVLNLRQQGLFALGYYHQRAHRNPSKEKDNG